VHVVIPRRLTAAVPDRVRRPDLGNQPIEIPIQRLWPADALPLLPGPIHAGADALGNQGSLELRERRHDVQHQIGDMRRTGRVQPSSV